VVGKLVGERVGGYKYEGEKVGSAEGRLERVKEGVAVGK